MIATESSPYSKEIDTLWERYEQLTIGEKQELERLIEVNNEYFDQKNLQATRKLSDASNKKYENIRNNFGLLLFLFWALIYCVLNKNRAIKK